MGGKIDGHKGPGQLSFHGRAGQGEWVWGTVTSVIASAFVAAVPYVGVILSIPFTIRMLAYSTRRLHDIKLSGWLQLAPMLLTLAALLMFTLFDYFGLTSFGISETFNAGVTGPGVDDLVADKASIENFGTLTPMEAIPVATFWIAMAAWLCLYGAMLFSPGTSGPNPYGEADR